MRRSALLLAAGALAASCGGAETGSAAGRGWELLPRGPLAPRSGHSAVWTGREMIVWGGGTLDARAGPHDTRPPAGYSYDPKTRKQTPLVFESYADGAAYDPVARTWERLPEAPLAARIGAGAVWTGDEMLVWGGTDHLRVHVSGAAYDPELRRWRTLPASPFDRSPAWAAVWTGRELIIWGGMDHQPELPSRGAAFDPKRNRWRTIAPFPLRTRQWHTAVWTGREMIVWGGNDLVRPEFDDGAAYDPRADRWRVLPSPPISGRYRHHAAWTGREMIVWGGHLGPTEQQDGAAYDPERNSWRLLADPPIDGRHWATFLWDGNEILVWGGYRAYDDHPSALADGAAYDPASNRWRRLPAGPLAGRCDHTAVWTGTALLIWGGTEACGTYGRRLADGAAYVKADT